MLTLILLMWFASVTMLVLGVAGRRSPSRVRSRVERLIESEAPAVVTIEAELRAPLAERVLRPALRGLAKLAVRVTPGGAVAEVRAKLDSAGNPPYLGVREFLGLRVGAALGACLVAVAVFRIVGSHAVLHAVAGSLLAGIAVTLLPDYLLQQSIGRRQYQIRKSLPDILDLLIVSVEAGLGFDGAMARVVEKMAGPFPEELARALQEMQLGKARTPALKDLAARVQVPEVSTFVAAVYQADQLGVSMSRVLHVQAETMRETRSQWVREMAAKLPVKILFPLVLCIFPAILIIIGGSAGMTMYRVLVGGN